MKAFPKGLFKQITYRIQNKEKHNFNSQPIKMASAQKNQGKMFPTKNKSVKVILLL